MDYTIGHTKDHILVISMIYTSNTKQHGHDYIVARIPAILNELLLCLLNELLVWIGCDKKLAEESTAALAMVIGS
jgi:hypothetical protein